MNYIDRMKEEFADLSNKLEKAEKALSILELNQIEHDYLLIQTSYMANYQAILKERIKYAEKKAGKLEKEVKMSVKEIIGLGYLVFMLALPTIIAVTIKKDCRKLEHRVSVLEINRKYDREAIDLNIQAIGKIGVNRKKGEIT